jgi:hypothetical protein
LEGDAQDLIGSDRNDKKASDGAEGGEYDEELGNDLKKEFHVRGVCIGKRITSTIYVNRGEIFCYAK